MENDIRYHQKKNIIETEGVGIEITAGSDPAHEDRENGYDSAYNIGGSSDNNIGDKIKAARKKAGITQKELAENINVTPRCIQYYESGVRKPQSTEIIIKLAAALHVDVSYLLSKRELELMRENEIFLGEAEKSYGKTGRAQAKSIIENTQALFAGGELDEEDKEAFFQAITELYFDSKKIKKRKKKTDGI